MLAVSSRTQDGQRMIRCQGATINEVFSVFNANDQSASFEGRPGEATIRESWRSWWCRTGTTDRNSGGACWAASKGDGGEW